MIIRLLSDVEPPMNEKERLISWRSPETTQTHFDVWMRFISSVTAAGEIARTIVC